MTRRFIMITEQEMKEISEEIDYIEQRLDILSSDNSIESQERRRLLQRLDFLEHQVNHLRTFSTKRNQRNHLKLISS